MSYTGGGGAQNNTWTAVTVARRRMFSVVARSWVRAVFVLTLCLLILGLAMVGATAHATDSAATAPALVDRTDLGQSLPTADSTGAATATVNANLRQGPGTTYPVVGGVTAGQSLEIVATNEAGDWYQLADGRWIFGELVEGARAVGVSTTPLTDAAPSAAQEAIPPMSDTANPVGDGWRLVADSAADFPGGRERNHWYYLWTEGRNNFVWQDMYQTDGKGCYQDPAGKGLEICADSMTAKRSGDVGLQWKASRGGTYRFEWDSPSLKFYKHADFVGTLHQGTQLPYAATLTGVIEWELFFWVAVTSTPYHVRVFRLEDSAAPTGAPLAAQQVATGNPPSTGPTANDVANLRAGPGTSYTRIGSVAAGAALGVVGRSAAGDWLKLDDGGWIAAFLVDNAPGALPVVAATPSQEPSRSGGGVSIAVEPARSAPSGNCDAAYPTVCIPSPPPDLDCGEIPYLRFTVLSPDPHGFDGDNDGVGCER